MLTKRWLLAALLIFSAVLTLSLFYFHGPSSNSLKATSFSEVDYSSLQASGQNEGETVEIEPNYQGSTRGIDIPPFHRYSLREGLRIATERLGVVLVPTLLPEGIAYSDVYVGPTIDLCFSYNKTENPQYADIVIEIGGYVSGVPTVDDMRKSLSPGFQLVQAEDKWVNMLSDYHYDSSTGQSWAYGFFFFGNSEYQVDAKYPLTNQDLTTIIANMKAPA